MISDRVYTAPHVSRFQQNCPRGPSFFISSLGSEGYNKYIKIKFIITSIVIAIPAFFLSHIIWPDPVNAIAPSSIQLALFMILSVLEALLFGIGVAFLVFGWPLVRQTIENRTLTTAAFLAIAWSAINWWPHDNMHRVNGENIWGLISIEYFFHFTLYIAAIILALYFWKIIVSTATKKQSY